ncbi:hypothetical protein GDO78_015889 [Eleutherodactylus coqui]|uniref:Uncharacterized protein n=1 Tax=Eleutherodactylus coqui TaxID=57060 RepID=A0A8J6BDU7_ELECQ|nr:hypothetical protein GDO78_015889 [Eleutherodactylus coqui]
MTGWLDSAIQMWSLFLLHYLDVFILSCRRLLRTISPSLLRPHSCARLILCGTSCSLFWYHFGIHTTF